jgi:hypothetical protein
MTIKKTISSAILALTLGFNVNASPHMHLKTVINAQGYLCEHISYVVVAEAHLKVRCMDGETYEIYGEGIVVPRGERVAIIPGPLY